LTRSAIMLRSNSANAASIENISLPEGVVVSSFSEGCGVAYSMYNYLLSDREGNRELLLDGLRKYHPNHPVRVVLNETCAE
jgi:hypothetical protein